MSQRDDYYNRAKQEGYRSRAAYKLQQLDERVSLVQPGDTVVDLGAAPGGWLQVAAELAGEHGRVIGVDRQRIDPIEGDPDQPDAGATVTTLRGDLTDAEVRETLRETVGEAGADVILSDMAPNMTGEYSVDHARSVHLARLAFEIACELLTSGGHLAVKVFEGSELDSFRAELEREFDQVRTTRPDATREASSEVYLIGKGRLTAPVRTGDQLTVTIHGIGEEGDGIAKVDGFTLFVPETEPGEEVAVEVTGVKPRFGFAERVD